MPTILRSEIGDIEFERPNLGQLTSVFAYRLMQFSIRDILTNKFSAEESQELLFEAGRFAGIEVGKNYINTNVSFNDFIAQLQKLFIDWKIGILRMEQVDIDNQNLLLTISEDLDWSGISVDHCAYDKGFLSGIFLQYSGKDCQIQEKDCWGKGNSTCRFEINIK